MSVELTESKVYASIVTIGYACLVAHFLLISDADPRWADNSLTGDEMYWYEKVMITIGVFSVVTNWFIATFESFVLGHKGWRWLNLFFWPTTLVYIWVSASGRLRKPRREVIP